jgi:RNA polymerase sigma-70 factor (ECF subfamily)
MFDNDTNLVRQVLAGNHQAFDEFFDRVGAALHRFAQSRLRDEDAAEEVVQATLCQAIRKLHTYRGEAPLLTWLFTFCRHEIFAYLKRHPRHARLDLDEDIPEIRAALESLHDADNSSPHQRLDRDRLADRVRRTLDYLPPHYARALEWKYIDNMSVREIARQLDLGPKAAESLLARARQAFRDAFRTMRFLGLSPMRCQHE